MTADLPAGAPAPARHRSLASLVRPRLRRVDLLIAVLLAVLGFAAAVQVRAAQDDGLLASARSDDLVRILDDLSGRSERLRAEAATLTAARERLASARADEEALQQARRRTQVLGVLAGTVPASGPGAVLTVSTPDGAVRADALLDALEELRDAGAEAVQLEGTGADSVRVVASTFLSDASGGVLVDDVLLRPPYRFRVVGDSRTLSSALAIPGGVVDTVARLGGTATVDTRAEVRVSALRPLRTPRYARPEPG